MAAVASAETFQFISGSTPFYLEGLDGVVVVKHPAGETDLVTNSVLESFPDWRSRTLFSALDGSGEAPAFSFFAHPSASAESFGFADGPGAPPPASSMLAQVDAVLPVGDVFLSPLLRGDTSCGLVVGGNLYLSFSPGVSEPDQLDFIESIGGVVLSQSEFLDDYYEIRIDGARTAFEVMAVAQQVAGTSNDANASVRFEAVSFLLPLCRGPVGIGTGSGGGSGGTGGGVEAVSVPVLAGKSLAVLVTLLVFAGLGALGGRRG